MQLDITTFSDKPQSIFINTKDSKAIIYRPGLIEVGYIENGNLVLKSELSKNEKELLKKYQLNDFNNL